MIKFDRQTLIILLAGTLLGYAGDALTYSIVQSEGKPFQFSLPTGTTAFNLLWTGILYGLLLDFTLKQITYLSMSKEERMLSDLMDKEIDLIRSGAREGIMPASVQWAYV
jgi:hypothetical protein